MAYEIVENADALMIHGNCFIDELVTPKPIIVEGDLVAERIQAPKITVRNGSLIVTELRTPEVDADILGIFIDRPFVPPQLWQWRWLRPVKRRPDPTKWTSEESIRGVIEMFMWPEITTTVAPIERLLVKVSARPTCGRARVLFEAALEELRDAKALTPLGEHVVMYFFANGDLPAHWRY